MIKILFVSRDLPEEGGSGTSVYRLSILRYLKKIGCEIDYLLLHYRDEKEIKLDQIKPFKSVFNVMQMKSRNPVAYPIWSSMPTESEIACFKEQVNNSKPDLIIVDHPWMSGLLKHKTWDKKIRTAVLTHDVQYKKIIDFMKHNVAPYKRNGNNKIPKWDEKLEKEILSYSDIILAIQSKDMKIFRKMLPEKKVAYLPISFDIIDLLSTKQVKGRCLFIGGSAQQNSYGIEWFLDKVWPILVRKNNSMTLHICGEVKKTMNLKKYSNINGVSIVGKIAFLRKEYEEAQVCVVPLRVGSGLKIKLIEAMSYGKACVSTSVGTYGVENVSDYGVDVADNEQMFAKCVLKLASNDKKRKTSELLNKQYIRTYLSPDVTYGAFVLDLMSSIKQNQT